MIEQLENLMAQVWADAREEVKVPIYDSGYYVCSVDRKRYTTFREFMEESGKQFLEETLENLKSENMKNIDLELAYRKDTGKNRPKEDNTISMNNEYVVWLESIVKSLIEVHPDLIETVKNKPQKYFNQRIKVWKWKI